MGSQRETISPPLTEFGAGATRTPRCRKLVFERRCGGQRMLFAALTISVLSVACRWRNDCNYCVSASSKTPSDQTVGTRAAAAAAALLMVEGRVQMNITGSSETMHCGAENKWSVSSPCGERTPACFTLRRPHLRSGLAKVWFPVRPILVMQTFSQGGFLFSSSF